MSGQVAIQRLDSGVYRVRFRKAGRLHSWLFSTAREACDAAAGILIGDAA